MIAMEVPEYRRRYEAELAKAAPPKARRRAAKGALTAEKPPSAAARAKALGALDFLGPRFAPFRADYKQALREIATDPERELRESALELLSIDKDPYAQELLVHGLKQPKDALVSEAKAIQFLGYDDHAEIIPLVRQVYRRAKGAAREEALRVLATD